MMRSRENGENAQKLGCVKASPITLDLAAPAGLNQNPSIDKTFCPA
jgi:hypothetical protein